MITLIRKVFTKGSRILEDISVLCLADSSALKGRLKLLFNIFDYLNFFKRSLDGA